MKTKISSDLFLEVAELQRIDKGLREDGFELNSKAMTSEWGIIRNPVIDVNFDFFKITETGDINKFRIKQGIAFDKDRLAIQYKFPNKDITIPEQGTEFWVVIKHKYSHVEEGTVKIGGVNKSILNGVGTKFTEVLRGQPNFPSKIKFLNSTKYQSEYEVLEVIDDNNVALNGIFDVSEENLEYAVVGTFTPGFQPDPQNKLIFQYDSCEINLIENITGEELPNVQIGKEFVIGKVRYTGAGITIQDYRFTCIYKTSDRMFMDSISENDNDLVGLKYVKKNGINFRNFYTVGFDWKFNISSEIQNNGVNTVAITSGEGGVYKSPAQFSDNECNGWRYYYEDGNYSTILSSLKQGSNTLLLFLDSVRIGSGAGVCITPNAEEIELRLSFLNPNNQEIFSKSLYFGIAQKNPTFIINQDEILNAAQRVRLYYVFKNHFRRTAENQFNSSTYYNENAFNSDGMLVNTNSVNTSEDLILSNVLTNSNPFVPFRCAMPWFPLTNQDITNNFDSTTGVGKINTQFVGWIILNGYNSEPDARGRTIVGAINTNQVPGPAPSDPDTAPLLGNPNISINQKGGKSSETLTEAQLAPHSHGIIDNGHSHTVHAVPWASVWWDSAAGRFGDFMKSIDGAKPPTQSEVATTGITIKSSGGGQPHNNMMPFLSAIWVMRVF